MVMLTPSEKAKERYTKSQEKEKKIEATILRHEAKKSKKMLKFTKDTGIEFGSSTANELRDRLFDTLSYEARFALGEIANIDEDIKSNHKKLQDQKQTTLKMYDQLSTWKKTEAVFDELPPIVLQFAEAYKQRCVSWLLEGAHHYGMAINRLREERKANPNMPFRDYTMKKAEVEKAFNADIRAVHGEYREDRMLAKAQEISEKNRISLLKMFAMRVKERCGTLVDAKGLRIGMNGELNGVVVGQKGAANVQTIAAGGYNIQCYHYRVLVQPIK